MKESTINSDKSLYTFIREITEVYEHHKFVRVEYSTGRQRSNAQNAALHKWCELVAKVLNDSGLEMRITLPTGKEWLIPWSKSSVKDNIWRPIQLVLTEKQSTTEPYRAEYNEIFEVIHSRFSSHHGITLPDWPCKESQSA